MASKINWMKTEVLILLALLVIILMMMLIKYFKGIKNKEHFQFDDSKGIIPPQGLFPVKDDMLLEAGLKSIPEEGLLADKTRIWGDLADDPPTLIKRMTDPGLEYEYNRINLPFYQDIIA